MQERVVEEHDAERVGPSWYLSRDGEQIGPLTDRELSLFAEGGNFRTGDLLWTAGLDGWKPAGAVFGLTKTEDADAAEEAFEADAAFGSEDENDSIQLSGDTGEPVFVASPLPEAGLPDASEPDAITLEAIDPEDLEPGAIEPEEGGDVHALVQALKGETVPPKLTLKERVVEELKKFAGIFIYLWVVFTILLLHEWIVLSEKHIGFTFYGLAMVNALVLGKIMLVADHFRFAEHLKHKPLIYPIVYKSVAFTTLLFVTYVLEEVLVGWIGGHGFLGSVPDLGGGLLGAAILWLIFCVALMPYFAFKEFERAVGPDMLRKLLLGRR